MNTVADRHRHSAYHNKHLWQAFCIHERRWLWMTLNPENIDLTWFFGDFWLQKSEFDEMDGDRLRLPANRNCYRLSRVSWALLKLLVNNWWYKYFCHIWPSNDHSIFYLTQCLFLHYLGKTEPKIWVEMNGNTSKKSPILSIVSWRRIDRF